MVRRVLLGLGLLVLAGAPGEAQPTAPNLGPPKTLREARERVLGASEALERLIERANKDPRFREVEAYLAYGEKDFDARGRITAKQIADIMADGKASFDVRKAAQEALLAEMPLRFDPDLMAMARRGSKRPRREFGWRVLAPMVKDSDVTTVKLTHELLTKLFGTTGHQDLRLFKPDVATVREKRKASDAWREILKD